MVDIAKVISHWRHGALEDWEASFVLVERGHYRHGLFLAHLALEKLLKAIVCQRTGELAPHIHDLLRLANIAGVDLDPGRRDVLAKMNAYALAGRYPDTLGVQLTRPETESRVIEAREVFDWLMTLLPA
jgi:HEPN domain-containing protein